MKARWAVAAMLMAGLGTAGEGEAQMSDSAATAEARRFIGHLEAGEWNEAGQMVAPTLRDRLGAAQLETVWGQIAASLGAGTVTRVRAVSPVDTMKSVELFGDFERDTVILRVVLSPSSQVVGFWVGPVPEAAPAESPPPPYVDRSRFREAEVRVGREPWLLPGTLSLPVEQGRHPAVVLVHGSGPHDRDETVGGTRVFRDLAWGLASQGIAVLRYEKRTRTHGSRMSPDVTVDQEVIEDALAALELVRGHPAIDPQHVYIAGHSLGAQLAPEIARRDGHVAGAVLLAAPARPIGVVMVAQLEYLASLPENASPEAQSQLEQALGQVRELVAGELPDTQNVLGARVSYFRDLAARDAVAEAVALDAPLLILQGERDYQVTMADFAAWQKALKDRPETTLRSFPSLNHLFVAGTGAATPAEYARTGFVAEAVVDAIADWVAATRAP